MTALHRFTLVLLLLLGVGVVPALAQDEADARVDERVPQRGSNRAIGFSLDGLSLGSLDGGVGAKWWISPNTALRTSFNFVIASDENVVEQSADAGRSAVEGGVAFMVEWHSVNFGRVSSYLGSGFGVGAGAFSQTTDFPLENPLRQARHRGSTLDFSVNAALGVEVRVSRRVSLAGEHLIGARVRTGSETRVNSFREAPEEVINSDLRSFTLGTGTSSLIVYVYF